MSLFNNIPKDTFISVYNQTDSDGYFHVCRYLDEDESFALFQMISTRGYDDGYYLILLDNIYRVDVDDDYTKRIKKLFELNGQPYSDNVCPSEETLLIRLLSYAKQNNLITSIFLEDGEDITGQINEINFDTEFVSIDKLTENGNIDGISFVRLNEIEKVICNSGVERCIEMLK